MTQTVVETVPVETASTEYFDRAEVEIENLAASGGSPAIVSILSLLLKGVSARAPTTTAYAPTTAAPYTSGSAVPTVTPTT